MNHKHLIRLINHIDDYCFLIVYFALDLAFYGFLSFFLCNRNRNTKKNRSFTIFHVEYTTLIV